MDLSRTGPPAGETEPCPPASQSPHHTSAALPQWALSWGLLLHVLLARQTRGGSHPARPTGFLLHCPGCARVTSRRRRRQSAFRPRPALGSPPSGTAPAARPTPYFVIHAFAAIGHDAEQAQGFGQVLGGLGFAGAGWTSRRPAQIHGQSLSEARRKTRCLIRVKKRASTPRLAP